MMLINSSDVHSQFTSLTWYTGGEVARVLRDKVIVDSVLERTQDNDRPDVVDRRVHYSFITENDLTFACGAAAFSTSNGRGFTVG